MSSSDSTTAAIIKVLQQSGAPLTPNQIAAETGLPPFVVRRALIDQLAAPGTALRRTRTDEGEAFALLHDPKLRAKPVGEPKAPVNKASDRKPSATVREGRRSSPQQKAPRVATSPNLTPPESGEAPNLDVDTLSLVLALTWKPLSPEQAGALLPGINCEEVLAVAERSGLVARLEIEAWGRSYYETTAEGLAALKTPITSGAIPVSARALIDQAIATAPAGTPVSLGALADDSQAAPEATITGALWAYRVGLAKVMLAKGEARLVFSDYEERDLEDSGRQVTTADVLSGSVAQALSESLPEDPHEALRQLAEEQWASQADS